MLSSPVNLKYKKMHCKRLLPTHTENRSFNLKFGAVGLKCLEYGKISARQLEAVRRVIRRGSGKGGQIKVNVFPNFSITKKAVGSRMGKGKGKHHMWISHLYPGKILFEMSQVLTNTAIRRIKYSYGMARSLYKLPIRTKVVYLKY